MTIYILRGIINTPQFNHYTSTLINTPNNIKSLKKYCSYYYDDLLNKGEIELITNNYRDYIIKKYPYIICNIKLI